MVAENSTQEAARSRTRVVVVAVALGVLVIGAIVAAAAAGDSDSRAAPATVESTVGGAASQPEATAATTAQGATAPTVAPPDQIVVTVAGTVKTILPDGDFVLDDGHTDYTVSMSATPSIVDLDGAAATADLIQLGGSVQVTGTVSGTTITAETVIVPIRPAPPTPHT